MQIGLIITAALMAVVSAFLFTPQAQAYVDFSNGSCLWQSMLCTFLTVAFSLKCAVRRLLQFIATLRGAGKR